LHRVCNKIRATTSKTSTLEDVDNVVPVVGVNTKRVTKGWRGDSHHDIHTGKLRPHLERRAKDDTARHTRLEEVRPGLGAFRSLEVNLLLDLLELENDEVVLLVASSVEVSKNLQRLFLPVRSIRLINGVYEEEKCAPVVIDEPTGGLGEREHTERKDDSGDHLETPWDTE